MNPAVPLSSTVVSRPALSIGRPPHPRNFPGICILFFVFCFGHNPLSAQDTSINKIDTVSIYKNLPVLTSHHAVQSYPFNKRRVKIVTAINIAAYSTAMVGLYAAWYKDYPQSSFHSFDDYAEWKQMDKIGHMYSAYAESKASMEAWRWTGIDRKKRIWIGGLSGAAYQTVIETLDGFSAEWGWSWTDFTANVMGSGLLIAQELAWDEQRIQMKWSFHRKRYDDPVLQARSDEIFGTGSLERFLKDYNGQTYWLSTTLKPFFPESGIPAWLQISVGTGVEGLFGARQNMGFDKEGNISFNRPDVKRYRQWYLAPDIDLTKIKTKKKSVKLILNVLNIVKVPTPSLAYSNKGFKWNWIHF